MPEPSKLAQVVNEMNNYKISILECSETHRPKAGEFTSENKSILFSGRNDNTCCQGVTFLPDMDVKNILLEWVPVNEQLFKARLVIPSCQIDNHTMLFTHKWPGGFW